MTRRGGYKAGDVPVSELGPPPPKPSSHPAPEREERRHREQRRARGLLQTAEMMGAPSDMREDHALAALQAIDALGDEIVPIGTQEALFALTVRCDDCSGSGEGGDSDFGLVPSCPTCEGRGRVIPGQDAQRLREVLRELTLAVGHEHGPAIDHAYKQAVAALKEKGKLDG